MKKIWSYVEWFDNPLTLSGSIATGDSFLAAEVMGADFAYNGFPFIATRELFSAIHSYFGDGSG
ncbi:hypothetical protein [Pseudogracilibacillus sp. SO30301A]|uniref:hypothetical protein n=1 Tax=Pseudogracilibacillus sp. SO30301A TaxID=3098291 RepID=UPI00300DE3F4